MNFLKLHRDATDRAKGDAARDRRDWAGAATSYRRHLDGTPGDADIWVQLGHALKELDRLEDAAEAYREATVLRPADDDAATHLGHVLKRIDRPGEAVAAFARIFERSGSREAQAELAGLPGGREVLRRLEGAAARAVEGEAVFIELDDMLGFLEAHRTLTGIQRVQIGVIRHVLAQEGRGRGARHVFVINPADSRALFRLRDDDLLAILDHLDDAAVDHDLLARLVSRARRGASALTPAAGQTLVALGAFWGHGGLAARYMPLKRAGLRLGAYIYDLIPITHYEYCEHGLTHEFRLSFGDAAHVFDFFLAISEFTAGELRRFLAGAGLPDKPVEVVTLAHASRDEPPPARAGRSRALDRLRGRPYALMVSTIEARKNHGYLLAAWKQFLDEGLEPPDLVFVGRVGWRVDSLMELLESTRGLDGRVHVMSGLADADLDALYAGCLFTAFPSFVEGWGLPVGESLAHGKPCAASSTSSIPEVGGDLVDYLDPHNLRDGLAVLRRMAFDPGHRARRAADIAARFRPRLWTDVGRDLLARIDALASRTGAEGAPAEGSAAPPFPAGVAFRPPDLALGRRLPDGYARSPGRLMLGRAWGAADGSACWLRGSEGRIAFRSDLAPGTAVVVYLVLSGGPAAEGGEVTAEVERDGDAPARRDLAPIPLRKGARAALTVPGEVGPGGLVRIAVRVEGRPARGRASSNPKAVVGLALVGHAAKADVLARVELQDAVLRAM